MMRSVLKISKDERGYAVECVYKDEVELTMAFLALLESLHSSKDMETAMAVALDIVTNESEDDIKTDEGAIVS